MFNKRKDYYKKLLQSKDLDIHHYVVSLKDKLTLQTKKKTYQGLDNVYEFDKTEDDETKKQQLKSLKNQRRSNN